MLISHSHQFIFIKTRKTAGTSVEMALEPFCTPREKPVVERTHARVTVRGVVGQRKIPQDEIKPLDRAWFHHMSAQKILRRAGPEIFDNYRKITCLRNPYSRLVSYFFWLKVRRHKDVESKWSTQLDEFKDFVHGDKWTDDTDVVMVHGKVQPTWFIRQEVLGQDLSDLATALSLDPALIKVPVTKKTDHHPSRHHIAEYFDEKTASIIKARCAWMFEAGNYDTNWKNADHKND